jgi:hypothetical protein
MRTKICSNHFTDANNVPCGGTTYGQGFTIGWQNGPLVVNEKRVEANGAFVEDVLMSVLDRIEYYQTTRFGCDENADAIRHIKAALARLNDRTGRRQTAGDEGTHRGS